MKYNSINIKIIIMALLILSITGCTQEKTVDSISNNKILTQELTEENVINSEYPINIIDDLQNEVALENEPIRVVSGNAAITEIIFALEMDNKLIGVSEDSNYPDKAMKIEKIGSGSELDIERMIELETDLVITGYISDETASKIDDMGINIIIMMPNDFDGIYKNIETIGKAINAKQEAENLVNKMRLKQNEIIERVSNSTKKRVFFELWNDPLMCFGSGSFVDKMIQIANGENIASDLEVLYPNISADMILEKDPEVYIAIDDGVKTTEDIKDKEGYENISAIKNERIYLLNRDIISRPGPRIVDALEMIAKVIHPELYYEK